MEIQIFAREGKTLTQVVKLFALVLMAVGLSGGASLSSAQASGGYATSIGKAPEPALISGGGLSAMNPVERVRNQRSWAYGPFVNYGTGVGDRSGYKFLWAGFHLSKPLSPVVHAGILSGQFVLGGEIMPLWQSYTPAPHFQDYICSSPEGPYTCSLAVGGGTFRGVSIEPVIFRWNFLTQSHRIQPWFQGAGGLIYTTHKFPPNVQSTQIINGQTYQLDGGTSVWNFSPQGGVGIHYFTQARRSIDFGINAVHISSASLGDRNPGVNASLQFQVGYTFWK